MGPNLDAARAYYEALKGRDAAALLEVLHPDAELRLTDGLPEGLGGSYKGSRAVLGVLGRVAEVFDVAARPETLLDAEGDRVVVLGRYVGRVRTTGRPLDAAFAHVLEFREGRVARHTQVTDSSRWANALGARNW
jgi:2-(1,2-epoxy-1,2-dihydrophenyl)acetyl-CoA isomerase